MSEGADLFPGLDPRLVNHYLAAFGVAGICAAATEPGGPTSIFVTRDATLKRASGAHVAAFWLAGEDRAKTLVTGVRKDLAHRRLGLGLFSIPVVEAGAAIQIAAVRIGFPLTSHSTMVMRTGRALAKIEGEFSRMQGSGEFKAINRAFRQARLLGDNPGKSYQSLCYEIRQRLISNLAANVLNRKA